MEKRKRTTETAEPANLPLYEEKANTQTHGQYAAHVLGMQCMPCRSELNGYD